MLCDIYDKSSILSAVENITKDWFNAKDLYEKLKSNKETEFSDFWNETDCLLDTIAKYLELPLNEFKEKFKHRCSIAHLKIMGYHCTRCTSKNIFYGQGVLPLSEKIIESFLSIIFTEFQIRLNECQRNELFEKIVTNDMWIYRAGTGKGPYFLLNYKDANNSNNNFHSYGSEVWWVCVDVFLEYCKANKIITHNSRYQCREVIAQKMVPLIVHCAIPYDLVDGNLDYYASLIFQSYFNFIDPENDIEYEGYSKGCSIDLYGKTLMPEHIVRIEEL